jgi:hypothetical protein
MKVKARISFSGLVSMGKGEEKEITDKLILDDLLRAGYVEDVKSKKNVKTNEN